MLCFLLTWCIYVFRMILRINNDIPWSESINRYSPMVTRCISCEVGTTFWNNYTENSCFKCSPPNMVKPVASFSSRPLDSQRNNVRHPLDSKLGGRPWHSSGGLSPRPTVAARVRAHVRSCGSCGGQSGTGAGILRVLVSPANSHFTDYSTLIINLSTDGWYNRSISGQHTKWTQSHCTPRRRKITKLGGPHRLSGSVGAEKNTCPISTRNPVIQPTT
jgi:hypothetical protein